MRMRCPARRISSSPIRAHQIPRASRAPSRLSRPRSKPAKPRRWKDNRAAAIEAVQLSDLKQENPMKALCWEGKKDVRIRNVPDPEILNPRDAIVRITSTAICGSDLHLYNGRVPGMQSGDILGHEFMGEVVEVGPRVSNLNVGDRVVVPFPISCGACNPCSKGNFSACDNSNPDPEFTESLLGHPGAGIFGYTKLHGAYAGGQAEYARVPFADVGPLKVPESLSDEQALFLSDIFPTGYQAAEHCGIEDGDTVAVWGCGPVGQFAIRSAFMMGAAR